MANIVHFGKYYFPDLGGIESVTVSLAKGAASAGHNVSVVCFHRSPKLAAVTIERVQVIRCPISRLIASQPLGIQYMLTCLKAAKSADIVHLHAPNMLGAICALLIPSKAQLLVHWHSDVVGKGFLGKLMRPLENALLRRANCIVATSKAYADASATLSAFQSKVAIVPIGVPDTKHGGGIADLPTSLEHKVRDKKIVLAVGRLVAYKGFSVLVEAAQYLNTDCVVVIVGAGPLDHDLQNAVERLGLQDRVVFAGRLADAALHSLFQRAALYCLSSIYRAEAFGVVLLEAMAYGLPIVATDIPGSGVPWVNQHGISGLNVTVGDAKALAQACNQILASEELRSKLSRASRQRYLNEFTEETAVNRMLASYNRLLSKS